MRGHQRTNDRRSQERAVFLEQFAELINNDIQLVVGRSAPQLLLVRVGDRFVHEFHDRPCDSA
jgi:hypothetical protein